MTKRIFLANFSSAIIASILCSIVLTMVTYQYFLVHETQRMKSQTILAAQAIEKRGFDFFLDLETEHYR